MYRLKDTYYTNQMLDGTPEQEGVKQLSPAFVQGDDIKLVFGLFYYTSPLDYKKVKLEGIVKKTPYASNILWTATIGKGLYPVDGKPGYFYILMPSEISGLFLPGTYYFDVRMTEKLGEGDNIRDMTVTMLKSTFTLELASTSPHPELRPIGRSEVTYDSTENVVTVVKTSVEITQPEFIDTRFP